jgi:hypothetical protein
MSTTDPDTRFFFEHAPYCVESATEPTPEQWSTARLEGAAALVTAERWAQSHGWSFVWEGDWDVNHETEYDCYEHGGPTTCECCVMYDEHGNVLASLGCIDDATDQYRRVVEAELALEAMPADQDD